MQPEPEINKKNYRGSRKLVEKTILITGGDRGIGRSVTVHFVRKGANIYIICLKENEDTWKTKKMIEGEGLKYEILNENLKKARVTEGDLRSKLREANIIELSGVHAVVFETTGDISVLHTSDKIKN